MLSAEQNETLTRVGPGTPMGDLMRYYWHPIAGASDLEENPVKKVRLLGEDLVLYRDRSGHLGLIDEPCPHRRVSLEYGIPEADGLRCPYHGWVFNHEGRCLEQPAEPWDSTFKDRITTKAYPVQELGGLVFAYLGPQPAPLLPRYDVYVWDNVVRQMGVVMLPCNWLQCMENSLDPVHTEWLHNYYLQHVWGGRGVTLTREPIRRHKRIGFDRFEHGIVKRRVMDGQTEEDEPWRVGHPVIFPNVLRIGANADYSFQIRVPVDDTHTWVVYYMVYRPGIPLPPQESVPLYEIPLKDEQGRLVGDFVNGQDHLVWVTQGPIARRDLEHLGQSDIGVIMYRELLKEQVERVARGEDPMEVYRDPAANVCITLPQEHAPSPDAPPHLRIGQFTPGARQASVLRFNPDVDSLAGLYQQARTRAEGGDPLLAYPELPVVLPGAGEHRSIIIRP